MFIFWGKRLRVLNHNCQSFFDQTIDNRHAINFNQLFYNAYNLAQCLNSKFNNSRKMAKIMIPRDLSSSISEIIKSQGSRGGLYLGNYRAANDSDTMLGTSISAIITLGNELVPPKHKGVRTLWIEIPDNCASDILYHIPKCVKFIDENIRTGNVFVHCKAGISRSATIVIAYIMFRKNYSLKKAKQRVKDKRPIINPNQGFMFQLESYEKRLLKKSEDNGVKSLQKTVPIKSQRNSTTNSSLKKTNSVQKMTPMITIQSKTIPLKSKLKGFQSIELPKRKLIF